MYLQQIVPSFLFLVLFLFPPISYWLAAIGYHVDMRTLERQDIKSGTDCVPFQLNNIFLPW